MNAGNNETFFQSRNFKIASAFFVGFMLANYFYFMTTIHN